MITEGEQKNYSTSASEQRVNEQNTNEVNEEREKNATDSDKNKQKNLL